MSKVIVVGGGASGMMSAIAAADAGNEVILLESNEKLGKKIYITGKGRCNFTNASDIEDVFEAVVSNKKFMYSAFYTFTNSDVLDFFEKAGMPYKIERGNRAFPVSDHSSDVIKTLEKSMKSKGVKVFLHTFVSEILTEDYFENEKSKYIRKIIGVRLKNGDVLNCDNVILANGGNSYQTTGSDGNGYKLAKKLGLKVTDIRPALVPLVTKEGYIPFLQGLSLKNVSISIFNGNKKLYEDFGEMLFTHFGISGPIVLSASSYISKYLPGELKAYIDLKPALSAEQLDKRLLREFDENQNKQIKSIIPHILPNKMSSVFLDLAGIDENTVINSITRQQRENMVNVMKHFPMTIIDTRGFKEAIVTQGGVGIKEINPSTMETKKVKGLYVVGELLDLDALTGGFNLQIAWSTGYLAGSSIID
ncbi:MAG: NAD(P)/FAD-dependent oxidoreductase [Lachnospiraceae bacterium]|nr:NAD(P)/FAD-dependent oxidoreductase [Lachnospiraceae bacterium]